ncbi:MAG TPA: NAD(+)/NADH kinase [Pirellulales bacterium]|nr:NAD(+)/NADH kinase [Pirellulales bacterium]
MSGVTPPAREPIGRPVRKLLLLASSESEPIAREAQRLLPLVAQHADVALVDMAAESDLSGVEFDVGLVLGGDGSILRAARLMGRCQRPVLGVNLGKLGFLADLSPAELCSQLPRICSGELPVVEHLMFDCTLSRAGQVVAERLGLNEVAIHAGAPFSVLDVNLYVDSELVTTYSCDGLILSTPVGSTAHSLSAGGPILRQDLQAFAISPISPHTLTNRPVVDSADRVYELAVPRPHAGTSVVVDGIVLSKLLPNDRVRVRRSESRFQLLTVPGHSYYRTLREKLGWGGRLPSSGS